MACGMLSAWMRTRARRAVAGGTRAAREDAVARLTEMNRLRAASRVEAAGSEGDARLAGLDRRAPWGAFQRWRLSSLTAQGRAVGPATAALHEPVKARCLATRRSAAAPALTR